MKKRKQNPTFGLLNYSSSTNTAGLVKFIFILIFLLLFYFLSEAQNSAGVARIQHVKKEALVGPALKVGCGAGIQVSGNGHGTMYNAYLNLTKLRNIYSIGLCVQKRSLTVSGIKLSYAHNLTGRNFISKAAAKENYYEDDGSLMLSLFSYVQYTHHTSLGYRASKTEARAQISDDIDRSVMKLSTAECGAGVEINCRLYKNIYLKNYVGANVYYHFNYCEGMYREKICSMLIVGTAIDLPYLNNK